MPSSLIRYSAALVSLHPAQRWSHGVQWGTRLLIAEELFSYSNVTNDLLPITLVYEKVTGV